MGPDLTRRLLDDPDFARLWLGGLGVRDPARGYRDLRDLIGRLGPEGDATALLGQLEAVLPQCPDPNMALGNVERFVSASASPSETIARLSRDRRLAEVLVQIASTSQYFSELMIRDPTALDWLRRGADRHDRAALIARLWAEVQPDGGDEAVRLALRRFRHREMLRIGYSDIVRGVPLEVTTLDLSHLADACVEVACRVARARAATRFGEPIGAEGRPARFVVLGLGKLGGAELNYSSDIDLIFLYDDEGETAGPRVVSNAEFFAKMGGEVVRLLADHTALGQAYRVDMRLRPEGDHGPLARNLAATLGYYETSGRTWERQALIKCRPVAGDPELGRRFLAAIAPFVYRRYLGAAEIGEIKAMKRRIEARTHATEADDLEVKIGRGGIRDVEFVVQFLQLLHGGILPEVRHPNTLEGMARLEAAGCLAPEERAVMDDTYRFLRRVEHRLQTMFDRQTHRMPSGAEEQRTLAIRMGYPPASAWEDRTGPADRFRADYRMKAERNRRILNHLLHDAFRADEGEATDPIVDLVLDPDPSPDLIRSALAGYPFRDPATAYRNLLALAREDIEFLSQARCRHFFAAIAPRLLQAVAATPDPDMTLTNLEKVSASLGAKAILWELFSANPPSLRLYVELCASSQFLSEILINNPGMIDDLMDSLVVDRPQPTSSIRAELAELCHGAEDLAPILLSFRNKEWVRVGVREILGREPIRTVTRELADVAEAIIGRVARNQFALRAAKLGQPRRAGDGRRARLAIVGLGKLGGRELHVHGDLDLIFLFDAEGAARGPTGAETPNDQFFGELAQRIIRALGGAGDSGALYRVDTRLRPHGRSGPLALPLDRFRQYFLGPAQAWERLALTRARPLFAQDGFGREVAEAIRAVLSTPTDPATLAAEVVAMRERMGVACDPRDLKRGPGGLVEVEFVVQYLQLVHAAACPEVLRPNTWEAIGALRRAGYLERRAAVALRGGYDLLRTLEGRLRLAYNRPDVTLPDRPDELARLARRLGHEGDAPAAVATFQAQLAQQAARTHELFDRLVVDRASGIVLAPERR